MKESVEAAAAAGRLATAAEPVREFRRFTPWWTTTVALGQAVLSFDLADELTVRSVLGAMIAIGWGALAFLHWRGAFVRLSLERIESGAPSGKTIASVADLVAVRWENPKAICFSERRSGGFFVLDLGGLTRRQRDEVRFLLREYVPAYREASPREAVSGATLS